MTEPALQSIEFMVNGQRVRADDCTPSANLLDFLRARGLTGAKEGCAEGECGACAVALIAPFGSASEYRVVNSCLLPVALAAGHEVLTVEGLASNGTLAPAQEAMASAGGSQCGYCTPGFVMSLFAEHYRPDRVGPCDPLALSGNLCRCTGYRPIRDAALSLGDPPPGALKDRLAWPAPLLSGVEAARFSRPSSLDALFAALGGLPDATLIAGGTDVGVEVNLRSKRWPHLVSLEALPELRQFSNSGRSIVIGAGLPLADIGRMWNDAPPAVHEWLELFASPSIRNRATLGGNLATASPIGDAAPLLLALDANVLLAGPEGRRTRALSSFFVGYRRTALRPREVIVSVEIPKPLPSFLRFYKIAKRRLDDISTVAAGMAIDLDAGGIVRRARFAFGGVAARPIRATEVEAAVEHQVWNEGSVERAQTVLGATLTPIGDHRGSKEYRLEVSRSLLAKCWWESRA
jgi:xanthine dehydrogenase small subunit